MAGLRPPRLVGMLSNTLSHLNKRQLPAINALLAEHEGFRHVVVEGVRGLDHAIKDLARDGADVLVVNGGDGTLCAALSCLCEQRPFAVLPPIAVLPSGMTNMTAFDVGPRGDPLDILKRLIALVESGDIEGKLVGRPVLRVTGAKDLPDQYGFFFGTAVIVRAIELCRDQAHAKGLEADFANAVTLARALFSWLISRGENAFIHGDAMTVAVDDGPATPATFLVALATTLDRLVLNSRPFWHEGEETAPIRFTTIAYPPRHLLRHAWRILYGRGDRRLPDPPFHSQRARTISLRMRCPFTIDGEIFETDPDKPVTVSVGERARFFKF